jgi:hypothetical protein
MRLLVRGRRLVKVWFDEVNCGKKVAFWHTSEMARQSGFDFRDEFRQWTTGRITGFWLCVLSLAAGLSGVPLVSQDGATPTLHVYTNTIQIPVLVLSPTRTPLAPIAGNRFSVSLDGGPEYRSTHVRLEGDDPISLSILVDARGQEAELMPKIDEAVAGLAPLSLRPRDHVSVYVLDCDLIRVSDDVPAGPEELKHTMVAALQLWTNRGGSKHAQDCQKPVGLRDALAYTSNALYSLPGRRVILAVTEGYDSRSRRSWKDLSSVAQEMGVTIFGLSYAPDEPVKGHFPRMGYSPFVSVCEMSGGMVLTATRWTEADELKRFTTLLRGRYIVEFPRPAGSTSGPHSLIVTIAKSDAFIRPAGIAVPIADPALLADPTTIPSDPSLTPELGKQRTPTTPQ